MEAVCQLMALWCGIEMAVRVSGVLWALLSTPVSVLVVFVGLALSAWTSYGLSDLSRPVPRVKDAQVREVPNPALRPWLRSCQARWARSRRKAVGSITGEVIYRVSVLSLAGAMGLVAASVALAPVIVTLTLRGRTMPVWSARSILLLGGIAGVASLIHVLWYWSRRSTTPRRFTPPVLLLPRGEIGVVRRVEFLRSVYLFTQLRLTTGVAFIWGMAGPALVSPDEGTGFPLAPERLRDVGGGGGQQALYVGLWFGGIALGAMVALLLKRLVVVRMPAADAAVALHRCLNPSDGPRGGATRHSGIVDPFGQQRVRLERATRTLEAIGLRMDLVRHHHPVASVLHGCAHYLRRFGARTDSLTPNCPADVQQVLRDAIAVVAGAVRPDFLHRVGRAVGAFDEEGMPESSLRARAPGRWASLVARMADSVDKYARLGNSVWAVVVLLVIAYLLATGKLDPTKIQIQK
ncbi:hypothetical protein ACFXGA_00810 [Actinosynnema sp. NPDC059335]|uniref:hypothetical protein n=1 Tax=Actinosynnema sp. NPDC059335 TaxID=3346804 RepID=UPI0036719773